MAVVDFTRPDVRNEISTAPFWVSSKEINYTDLKANTLVLAAFRKGAYRALEYAIEVINAGAANSGYTIEFGTTPVPMGLSTPQYDYDGVTISNAAVIKADADDGASSIAQATIATSLIISTSADVVLTVREDDDDTITAGKFRVHVLMCEVPFAAI